MRGYRAEFEGAWSSISRSMFNPRALIDWRGAGLSTSFMNWKDVEVQNVSPHTQGPRSSTPLKFCWSLSISANLCQNTEAFQWFHPPAEIPFQVPATSALEPCILLYHTRKSIICLVFIFESSSSQWPASVDSGPGVPKELSASFFPHLYGLWPKLTKWTETTVLGALNALTIQVPAELGRWLNKFPHEIGGCCRIWRHHFTCLLLGCQQILPEKANIYNLQYNMKHTLIH